MSSVSNGNALENIDYESEEFPVSKTSPYYSISHILKIKITTATSENKL